MQWFFLAFLASIFTACLAEINRTLKLESNILNAWRASFASVVLAFFYPWMRWPDDRMFYIIAGIDGAVNLIAIFMFLYLAAKKTGRVTSMSIPVSVMFSFFLSWMFVPENRLDIVEHPIRAGFFWLSIIVMFTALQKIRRNDNSWDSFVFVLPVGMLFGAMFFLRSMIIGPLETVFPQALSYTFVVSIVCAALAWVRVAFMPSHESERLLFDPRMLLGGAVCGVSWASMFMALLVAIAWAPNPAFPAMLLSLTPVWLLAYNKLMRIPDDASPAASMVMVAGAIGLLLSVL